MIDELLKHSPAQNLIEKVAGLDQPGGDPRLKQIVPRVVGDLFKTIDDLDVTPTEFWSAVSYLSEVAQANELGLLVPGLGFEHFLDLRFDEKERQAGLEGGTPRTVEGPLWVAGAPTEEGEARLDQDPDAGEVLFMNGQVRDTVGNPVPHAFVDVWDANTKGGYSFFDKTRTAYNLRRQIRTDAKGRYKLRSILPNGYGCPPDGPTYKFLAALGRHAKPSGARALFRLRPGFPQADHADQHRRRRVFARRLRFRHP